MPVRYRVRTSAFTGLSAAGGRAGRRVDRLERNGTRLSRTVRRARTQPDQGRDA